jgi:hypothetical protein
MEGDPPWGFPGVCVDGAFWGSFEFMAMMSSHLQSILAQIHPPFCKIDEEIRPILQHFIIDFTSFSLILPP